MRASSSLFKRRQILTLLIVLVFVLAAGWEVASPWLALKAMRDAARERDSDRLATYVDFPQLRASVRDELVEGIAARAPTHGLAALTHKLGRKVVRPIVDVIVSPTALEVALLTAPPPKNGTSGRKCGIKRDGLSRFRLRCAKLAHGEGDLVFERRGLGWVLVGVDLPADYRARPGALVE